MQLFFQQLLEGIAVGSIYASLGLALSLIYRMTGVANFAQGEMALLSTYTVWQLIAWGVSLWLAVPIVLVGSMLVGAVVWRVVVKPVQRADHLTVVILTFGLYLAFNNLAGFIWGFVTKPFPALAAGTLFRVGNVPFSWSVALAVFALISECIILFAILKGTRIGLAIRAASENPDSSMLVGIDINRVYMTGWALAAGLGALSGVLVAPRVFLDPTMMISIIISAFAGIVLGGIGNPIGAAVGCIFVGVIEILSGAYVSWIGADLRILVPLTLIVFVLLIRPAGLFAVEDVSRV
jgi:branched-chain amino acid transport system permease protein